MTPGRDSSLRLSRRAALGRLGALLAAGLWPGALRALAPGPGRGFRFAALNDLHHRDPGCEPWFAELFENVAAARPAFTLLLGDLADQGARDSLAAVARLAGARGARVHAVPGNHDHDVTPDGRLFAEAFPGQENQTFTHEGWQFVGLDTTQGEAWHDTRVGAVTLAWLDAALPRLDPARPTVIFTHFPLVPGVRAPNGVPMTPLNAEEVLARFERFNLRAALCGHFHGRRAESRRGAELSTHATCGRVSRNHDGTTAKGWRLCTARADGTFAAEFMPVPARPAS